MVARGLYRYNSHFLVSFIRNAFAAKVVQYLKCLFLNLVNAIKVRRPGMPLTTCSPINYKDITVCRIKIKDVSPSILDFGQLFCTHIRKPTAVIHVLFYPQQGMQICQLPSPLLSFKWLFFKGKWKVNHYHR